MPGFGDEDLGDDEQPRASTVPVIPSLVCFCSNSNSPVILLVATHRSSERTPYALYSVPKFESFVGGEKLEKGPDQQNHPAAPVLYPF